MPDEIAKTAAFLVDIPSPTGQEGALARAVVSRLGRQGICAREQELDDKQSNAWAVLRGKKTQPSLLLYSPVDTVTSDDADEDLPWAGPTMLPEMQARSQVRDGHVFGLGAQNPKGHAACVISAFEAIAMSGVQLEGDLMLGLGAGGMPTNARPSMRPDSGHGVGCSHMIEAGERPDYAVIAKSGWAVSWEEVGLAWYEVQVRGTHTYVGSRHLLPYVNAIGKAAKVIVELEDWFPEWSDHHRSGLVAPQGVVSFIQSGWERMPAFTAALCRFRFDLRVSPRTTAEEVDFAVSKKLRELAAKHLVDLDWSQLVFIPGTTTSPESPIVKVAVEGWEHLEGKSHTPIYGMSGATDANILRLAGIPTARIGLPKANLPGIDFQAGMNTVSVNDMVRLAKHLIYAAVATCCR